MTKDIKKLMKKANYTLLVESKHLKWIHNNTKQLIITSKTPSNSNYINRIKSDIKRNKLAA